MSMNAKLPEKIDRYEIKEIIGKGSMGVVYRAHDPVLEREVAIKTIEPHLEEDKIELEKFIERFKREAKAAGKLNHPNIVTIYDFGFIQESTPYIVMELIRGRTLKSYFEEDIRFELATVKNIVIQIARALEYAHKFGIVHRDIKPANIMILEDFSVKIADFGIARLPQSELTKTGEILGTPNYMSPEQITGTPVDSRVDLYALGVILYQLLTGERPFLGDTFSSLAYRIVHEKPLPPKALNPSIPQSYSDIVAGLLEKDRTLRPSIKNLIDALDSIESSNKIDLSAKTIQSGKQGYQMPTEELMLEEISFWEKSLTYVQSHVKRFAIIMTTLIVICIITYLVANQYENAQMQSSKIVPVAHNKNLVQETIKKSDHKTDDSSPESSKISVHESETKEKENEGTKPANDTISSNNVRAQDEEAIISLPVKHIHTFSPGCHGTLIFTKDYIEFNGPDKGRWKYSSLRGIERSENYLTIKTYEKQNLKVGKIKLLNIDYKDYKFRLGTTELNQQIDELLKKKKIND